MPEGEKKKRWEMLNNKNENSDISVDTSAAVDDCALCIIMMRPNGSNKNLYVPPQHLTVVFFFVICLSFLPSFLHSNDIGFLPPSFLSQPIKLHSDAFVPFDNLRVCLIDFWIGYWQHSSSSNNGPSPSSSSSSCSPLTAAATYSRRLLGRGSWFGDSVLDDSPRDATASTRGPCKLLRVEQRDFRSLWQVPSPQLSFYLFLANGGSIFLTRSCVWQSTSLQTFCAAPRLMILCGNESWLGQQSAWCFRLL